MNKTKIIKAVNESFSRLAKLDADKYASIEIVEANGKVNTHQTSVFPVAMTVHAIAPLLSANTQKKLTNWFILQAGKNYSFNYWLRGSDLAREHSLPDDLDDTAYSLSALAKLGYEIDAKYLLKLIRLEEKPGGPYRTWYLPDREENKKWRDIDPYVNANAAYALALLEVDVPNTHAYLLERLEKGDYHSQFYPNRLFFLFFLSRYAQVKADREVLKTILSQVDTIASEQDEAEEDLNTLLRFLIYSYCSDSKAEELIGKMLNMRDNNGFIKAMPMWYAVKPKLLAQSQYISTALFIEGCCQIDWLQAKLKARERSIGDSDKYKSQLKQTVSIVAEEISSRLESESIETESLFAKKAHELKAVKLPCAIALVVSDYKLKGEEEWLQPIVQQMAYGWLGYTLMDNLIDDGAQPQSALPMSTLQKLHWQTFYENNCMSMLEKEKYMELIDLMEKNYRIELKDMRFDPKDREGQLRSAKKVDSYGYINKRMSAFTYLCQLVAAKASEDEDKAQAIRKIIGNLVLIDQLADDAHDYQSDLAQGIMTYVASLLVKSVSDKTEEKHVREAFWREVMPELLTEAEELYEDALSELQKYGWEESLLAGVLSKSYAPLKSAQAKLASFEGIVDAVAKM
jgi:hypothetical protein